MQRQNRRLFGHLSNQRLVWRGARRQKTRAISSGDWSCADCAANATEKFSGRRTGRAAHTEVVLIVCSRAIAFFMLKAPKHLCVRSPARTLICARSVEEMRSRPQEFCDLYSTE